MPKKRIGEPSIVFGISYVVGFRDSIALQQAVVTKKSREEGALLGSIRE